MMKILRVFRAIKRCRHRITKELCGSDTLTGVALFSLSGIATAKRVLIFILVPFMKILVILYKFSASCNSEENLKKLAFQWKSWRTTLNKWIRCTILLVFSVVCKKFFVGLTERVCTKARDVLINLANKNNLNLPNFV